MPLQHRSQSAAKSLAAHATPQEPPLRNSYALERASDETRRNLRAVEKNPQAQDLRQKLTKRLLDASTRLDTITKRSIELRMSADELQIRFRDAVRD